MFISTPSLGMTDHKSMSGQPTKGKIKWFDPARGFGFLTNAEEDDVLIHSSVLRSYGESSVAEGALVEFIAVETPRGRQAVEVLSITPPPFIFPAASPLSDLGALSETDFAALPLVPARVKWFDRRRGFGFANVFGRTGDVFLHIDVLRRCGFTDLIEGQAIGLRVFSARRGMVAAEVTAWTDAGGGSKP